MKTDNNQHLLRLNDYNTKLSIFLIKTVINGKQHIKTQKLKKLHSNDKVNILHVLIGNGGLCFSLILFKVPRNALY